MITLLSLYRTCVAIRSLMEGPVMDGPVMDGPVMDGPIMDGQIMDGQVTGHFGEDPFRP